MRSKEQHLQLQLKKDMSILGGFLPEGGGGGSCAFAGKRVVWCKVQCARAMLVYL
jgi:hypothetical protein